MLDGYTRVTEILSQWDKSSHIDQVVYEKKTQMGTNVHDAIANSFRGIPTILTDDEGGKYFSSFLLWRAARCPVVHAFESRMYDHERKITGAMDAVVKFPSGEELFLIDWKTSYSADKCNWPLQASFYMQLLELSGIVGIRKCKFIKLDKLGDMPIEYDFEQSEYLIDMCNHAIETYRYNSSWLEKRKAYNEEIV